MRAELINDNIMHKNIYKTVRNETNRNTETKLEKIGIHPESRNFTIWPFALFTNLSKRGSHCKQICACHNLLINLRSPRDCPSSGWVGRRSRLYVLDRKLLERLMSPSPKSQLMFASAFSRIGDFFRIFGIHIFQVMASKVNLV